MKVLSIHNRYLIRGGEDECLDAEVRLLRQHGNQVEVYLDSNERVATLGTWRTAVRTVWSQETYSRARQTLHRASFDLVAAHNTFPLISPSVYYAATAEGVPVVQTLHNYRLLCPDAFFFRDGRVCEDCLGRGVPWPGVVHACYRGSRAATVAVAAMLTIHRAVGTWRGMVDVFIALTEFARQKFIQGGLPADRIRVKPNFVEPDPGIGEHRGDYALFVGRLSREKGIETLLEASRRLGRRVPIKVVGEGTGAALTSSCDGKTGIEWLGRRPLSEVYDLMGNAAALIVPSKWYEGFPRVIVEAFAKGTPVIGANIGGIAEIVQNEVTGLLFNGGDGEQLAAKIDWAWSHPNDLAAMGLRARRDFETKYTAERNYQILREIYEYAAGLKR